MYSLFLPALTLALPSLLSLSVVSAAALIDALEAEYVVTARSKGIPERRVIVRHALRNAIVSTITVLGLKIA